MEDSEKAVCSSRWSWEENKLFEVALTAVGETEPDRWQVVAATIGGQKSAEDVYKHYEILLEDLNLIESGHLDRHFISDLITPQSLGLLKIIARL